jgi:hypothetical protein
MPSVAPVEPIPIWTVVVPSGWSVRTAPPSTWLPFIGWKTTATMPLEDGAALADASIEGSLEVVGSVELVAAATPPLLPAEPVLHAANTSVTTPAAAAAGSV